VAVDEEAFVELPWSRSTTSVNATMSYIDASSTANSRAEVADVAVNVRCSADQAGEIGIAPIALAPPPGVVIVAATVPFQRTVSAVPALL
jgi:hypothetical protein